MMHPCWHHWLPQTYKRCWCHCCLKWFGVDTVDCLKHIRGVDAIDCLKWFGIDTIDCLKRTRGVDAIDCLKWFGVDTIDCLKCIRGVDAIEFANRFATWFICWFAYWFFKSNQMIFLNLTSSNRAQACECICIACQKKDWQQHKELHKSWHCIHSFPFQSFNKKIKCGQFWFACAT